jgi:hypothetical protein
MYPFVASQAIALRQVKQRPVESRPAGAERNPQPRAARKAVFPAHLGRTHRSAPAQGRHGNRHPWWPERPGHTQMNGAASK